MTSTVVEAQTPGGRQARFVCRDGTSDAALVRAVVGRDEYALGGQSPAAAAIQANAREYRCGGGWQTVTRHYDGSVTLDAGDAFGAQRNRWTPERGFEYIGDIPNKRPLDRIRVEGAWQ